MPGPPPKPPEMRQRRNKTVAGVVLPAEGSGRNAPPLPARACYGCQAVEGAACARCEGTGVEPWHPLVSDRWTVVWASPMGTEFVDADIHGLFLLADLWDLYWKGDKSLAAEIRLQEQRFGLSSLDRRRLQWTIAQVEQAQKRRPAAPVVTRRMAKDPRAFLKAVK